VDILGELGGYIEVLYVIFLMIVYPFAEYGFMVSSINKLFLAKTLKPEDFKGRQKRELQDGIHKFSTPYEVKERDEPVYAIITLSYFQKVKLFG
jgi:hypothetical protein